MRRINIGYFYAVLAGIVSGLVPVIFQKVLAEVPIPRTTGLFIKLAVSSLVLLPFALSKIKKGQFSWWFYWNTMVSAVLYVGTLLLLYQSYNYIPTGISISLHYTFPFFTMVFSALFFRFLPTKQSVVAMLFSLVGVALLSNGSLSDGGKVEGILLAIGSAVVYAVCFLWIDHKNLTTLDTTVFVTLKTCGSAILLFPYVLVTDGFAVDIPFSTFSGLLVTGVFTILASFLMMLAIKHIGSVHTSILSSMEPIVCAVAGVIFLEETVGLKSGVGIAMVLVATIMVSLGKREANQVTKDKR